MIFQETLRFKLFANWHTQIYFEESVDQDKKYNEEANFSEIFSFKNFRDAWRSLLKKREGYKRMIVILLILAFELEIFLR